MRSSDKSIPGRNLRRLRRSELPVDTVELARFLIGKVVVHETAIGRLSGRIVETEAYPLGDSAGHAFRGQTPRNRSLFLRPGHAYVYFIYGVSFMLNVSSEPAGVGGGVLLRALEPLEGIEQMQRSRGTARLPDLARGPGRLAQAMQIDFKQDGLDLCGKGPLWLGAVGGRQGLRSAARKKMGAVGTAAMVAGAMSEGAVGAGAMGESVRIGLSRNVDLRLRFYERDNPFVSGPARLRE